MLEVKQVTSHGPAMLLFLNMLLKGGINVVTIDQAIHFFLLSYFYVCKCTYSSVYYVNSFRRVILNFYICAEQKPI